VPSVNGYTQGQHVIPQVGARLRGERESVHFKNQQKVEKSKGLAGSPIRVGLPRFHEVRKKKRHPGILRRKNSSSQRVGGDREPVKNRGEGGNGNGKKSREITLPFVVTKVSKVEVQKFARGGTLKKRRDSIAKA